MSTGGPQHPPPPYSGTTGRMLERPLEGGSKLIEVRAAFFPLPLGGKMGRKTISIQRAGSGSSFCPSGQGRDLCFAPGAGTLWLLGIKDSLAFLREKAVPHGTLSKALLWSRWTRGPFFLRLQQMGPH